VACAAPAKTDEILTNLMSLVSCCTTALTAFRAVFVCFFPRENSPPIISKANNF